MRILISSTIRTFIHGDCSYGTLHLKGVYVPAAAASPEEDQQTMTSVCKETEDTLCAGASGTATNIDNDNSSTNGSIEAAVSASARREITLGEQEQTSFVVRCIDTTTIPNELNVFVQFDLPPACTVLQQRTASQITSLVLRVLDDLQDIQQQYGSGACNDNGAGNEGFHVVSNNILDFLQLQENIDHPATDGDIISSSSSGQVDRHALAPSSVTTAAREIGVVAFSSNTLSAQSRFVRAKQKEAALRFQLNVGDSARGSFEAGASTTPGSQRLGLHSFAISQKQLICMASVARAGVGPRLLRGDHLSVQLDFTGAMQPCTAVKVQICSKKVVTVPKIGVRVDRGSLNNGMEGELSKVLSSGVKSTQDALVVNLSVPLPSEDGEGQGMSSGVRGMVLQSSAAAAAHSHSSNHTLRRGNCTDPTHTRYWLEFYFYLQQELITSTSILPFSYLGGGDSDIGVVQPPFTWSIPLDVFATSGVGESLQNLQPLHVSGTAQMYVKN